MGTNVRQNIVTNGLVLYLDAGSRMSYNSGSTTWRDLSGNNYSGSLINGPIFSNENQGNIVFDGVNDYVTLSSGSGINVGVTFTLQTWVKVTRFGGFIGGGNWNRASIISNSYPYTANQGFYLTCTSQNPAASWAATPGYETFLLSLGQDNSVRIAQYGSLTNYVNKWVNLSAVVNSATPIRLYINGIETAYANFPWVPNGNGLSSLLYSARPCFLGARNELFEYAAASIGLFTMYNRALSQQELNQNYNATKNRFGLF